MMAKPKLGSTAELRKYATEEGLTSSANRKQQIADNRNRIS